VHAAAVAATQDLDLRYLPFKSKARQTSGEQWLDLYGQHVTSLQLHSFSQPLRQLPCHDLLDLAVTFSGVQLGAADGFSGVIPGCTKLVQLALKCDFIDVPEGGEVDSLSSLMHLESLHLVPTNVQHMGGLSSATLPRLQHLTYLKVDSLSVENLLQLGGLISLQELHLVVAGDTVIGPSSVPGLVFPTSLQKLELGSSVEAGILSLVPTRLQELQLVGEIEGPAEGPGSLLSCMPRLQHLTRLNVRGHCAWAPLGPIYSALTASSNLMHLELSRTLCPGGIGPFVFPAGRQLRH
jgi:hypothetical protein